MLSFQPCWINLFDAKFAQYISEMPCTTLLLSNNSEGFVIFYLLFSADYELFSSKDCEKQRKEKIDIFYEKSLQIATFRCSNIPKLQQNICQIKKKM